MTVSVYHSDMVNVMDCYACVFLAVTGAKAVAGAHQAPQLTIQCVTSGLILQEAKSDKDAEAVAAAETAATERDKLKAQIGSLTNKVSDVEAQLQKASHQKQAADKELPSARSQL